MEKVPQEVWRPVVGYEGFYEVSSLGRVRSIPRTIAVRSRWGGKPDRVLQGKLLRIGHASNGYHQICLYKGCGGGQIFRIHRLVALAFLPNPHGLPDVNHKDGDKENNRADNLEWCTKSQNMKHAFREGLTPGPPTKRGSQNESAHLTEEQVLAIRAEYGPGMGYHRLAKKYGVGKTTIVRIIKRTHWTHL